jgi:2-methylcitrate dehydratase
LTGGVDGFAGINIIAYEPAFGIIGDPAKKDPKTRQLLGLFGIHILYR